MLKNCVLSGNCLLSKVGQETSLKDYYGNILYTGDLVHVVAKEDYECSVEARDIENDLDSKIYLEELESSMEGVNVVVKDSITTYNTGKVVVEDTDTGWIFGWKNADMKRYHIFKVKDYTNIENGFNYNNFRYDKKEL
jgi:hypothetical protein